MGKKLQKAKSKQPTSAENQEKTTKIHGKLQKPKRDDQDNGQKTAES